MAKTPVLTKHVAEYTGYGAYEDITFAQMQSVFENFSKKYNVPVENCVLEIDYEYGYYPGDVYARLYIKAEVPKTEEELANELIKRNRSKELAKARKEKKNE